MANLKLENDFWETSGVFDLEQNETQREINRIATKAKDKKTESGDVVTFNDGVENMPLNNLTVNIEPLQSGSDDPSPTNIRPITGWTGCNVYKNGTNFSNGLTFKANTFIDENGNETSSTYMTMDETYIPCKAGDKFFISITPRNDGRRARVHEYNSAKQWIRQIAVSEQFPIYKKSYFSWVASSDAAYVRFSVPNYNSISVSYGEIIPFIFPSSAGTVYGGTLDVTNGTLTIDKALLTVTPTDIASMVEAGTGRRIYLASSMYSLAATYPLNIKCNYYNKFPVNYTEMQSLDMCIALNRTQGDQILIHDSTIDWTTDTPFLTRLQANPLQIVYPVAVPTKIILTPTEVKTLLGQNNIWADCGTVDVEYGAYLTMVENQLGEKIPKIAVAPIEKTTTASKAYAVNEMFFMGDKLYIATASIASGATFTVGTNCDETTLGAQITALLNA